MEPAPPRQRHEAIDHDDLLVHERRVTQLTRLGIPWSLAQAWPTDLRINGEKALREARHVDFRGRPAVT
jgi:hypothetical protein